MYVRRVGRYGLGRPRLVREPGLERVSLREACQDPTKLTTGEAMRRIRMIRKGLPWEPPPRLPREEYTPPEPEPDPEE